MHKQTIIRAQATWGLDRNHTTLAVYVRKLQSNVMFIFQRFGMCEPYKGGVEVCNDVLSDVDYVFITKSHGSQENISHFLETNIPHSLLTDDNCREMMFQLICHYYLIPCGSEGSELPPSSICREECSMVESTCPSAWQALRLGLEDYKFISCDDTSALLFPLPNCCTGVGIQEKGF